MPDVSVVIPIYNEEACVDLLAEKLHAVMSELGRKRHFHSEPLHRYLIKIVGCL